MEEPGRLQSMGSLRVGHDWATSLSLFTFMHWRRRWQPTPVFLPGESQGQAILVGCRLWGRTESDTTEVTQQQQQEWRKTLPLTSPVGLYVGSWGGCYLDLFLVNQLQKEKPLHNSLVIKPLRFPGGARGKEPAWPMQETEEVWVRSLGPGRSPGGGHGNPLQCSLLENPMDWGAWRALIHGVAKSWTQLKRQHAYMHGTSGSDSGPALILSKADLLR